MGQTPRRVLFYFRQGCLLKPSLILVMFPISNVICYSLNILNMKKIQKDVIVLIMTKFNDLKGLSKS